MNWAELAKKRWKTRDGTVLFWGEMKPSHLRNAAAMIRRNVAKEESAGWSAGCMLQGDMATMYWEQGMGQMMDDHMKHIAYAKLMEAFATHLERKKQEASE